MSIRIDDNMGRKGVKTKFNTLTEDEVAKLNKSSLSLNEKLVVYSLLFTGLRIGEFIHMKKEWIDWDRAIIQIPARQKCDCHSCHSDYKYRLASRDKHRNVVRNDSGDIIYKTVFKQRDGFWKPKTEKGIRAIPILPKIFPESWDILKKYFEKHETIMETIPHRGSAWRLIDGVRKKVGIEHKLFPHAFRGTYATLLASAGLSEMQILDIMGWERTETAKVYIGLSEKVKKDRQEILKKVMEDKLTQYQELKED